MGDCGVGAGAGALCGVAAAPAAAAVPFQHAHSCDYHKSARFCGSRRFVCTGTRLAPPGARARSKAERLRTELTPIRSQREGWFLYGARASIIALYMLGNCNFATVTHRSILERAKEGGSRNREMRGSTLDPPFSIQFQCRPPFSVLPAPFRLSTVVVRWSCKPKVPGSNPGGGCFWPFGLGFSRGGGEAVRAGGRRRGRG